MPHSAWNKQSIIFTKQSSKHKHQPQVAERQLIAVGDEVGSLATLNIHLSSLLIFNIFNCWHPAVKQTPKSCSYRLFTKSI